MQKRSPIQKKMRVPNSKKKTVEKMYKKSFFFSFKRFSALDKGDNFIFFHLFFWLLMMTCFFPKFRNHNLDCCIRYNSFKDQIIVH